MISTIRTGPSRPIVSVMAELLYGGGLRLLECIRLWVQDVDFSQGLIFIQGGKGGKDRTTILSKNLQGEREKQIEAVKFLHHKELEEGFGEVYIPEALASKLPTLLVRLFGSGFFRPRSASSIRVPAESCVIMPLNPGCKRR